MMYPYMTLADDTEIVHSQIIEKNGKTYTGPQAYHMSENKYGRALCSECVGKLGVKPLAKE